MTEFLRDYWWFIICVVSGAIYGVIQFMSFYKKYTDEGKEISKKEVFGCLFVIVFLAIAFIFDL